MREINGLHVSDSAAEAARLDFNPSKIDRVARLKALAGAFITECEDMQADNAKHREASEAIRQMEQAAMWAVKAATKGM